MELLLQNCYLLDHNYIVSTPMGEMRRNRQHLTKILDSENGDSTPEQTQE